MTPRNNRAGLACVAVLLSASAQASNYRFGATQDRVVSNEDHGYTQHITPDFEVQDGIAVTYVRLGKARVARLVATDYAAKVYSDVAPLAGADGKISAGDAWISQQASTSAVSLPVTPTPVDRLLLSGARRILYESVPTTVYFAHDHLGSLTVETDDQGAVIGQRAYSTWGGERAASGDGDSYGFTGQRQDDGGTVHFSFRQLDPATGRWSSTDPLFHFATPDALDALGEATTAYAYVANNPSNLVDPNGLEIPRRPGWLAKTGPVRRYLATRQIGFLSRWARRSAIGYHGKMVRALIYEAGKLWERDRDVEVGERLAEAGKHRRVVLQLELISRLSRDDRLSNGAQEAVHTVSAPFVSLYKWATEPRERVNDAKK
jgi:RHS repeat-associated protein